MIDAAQAVSRAQDYFTTFFKDSPLTEVLLEEAELADDGRFWDVTFGFDYQPGSGSRGLGPGERMFKVVRIDAESGNMVSMKNAVINS